MSLLQRVARTIEDHALLARKEVVVLGVSGGADSLCLLHLMRRLAPDYDLVLHVGHLDHQLRGRAAQRDAAFVARLCRSWHLACTVEAADVAALARKEGLSIEQAARRARYAFLAALARRVGARTVAVAHNADDQVETVLMHILRGSGLRGLGGMRHVSRLDESVGVARPCDAAEAPSLRLIRPLLDVERRDIEAYCQRHDLRPRCDRTNADSTYLRNRIRHELLPYLETFNSGVREAIRRLASILAADDQVLRECVQAAWSDVVMTESRAMVSYDLGRLCGLSFGLQRSLLREGVKRLGHSLRDLELVHVDEALDVVRRRKVGARVTLAGGLVLTVDYCAAILSLASCGLPLQDRPRLAEGTLALDVPGTTPLPASEWVVVTNVVHREAVPEHWDQNPHPYTAYLDAACLGRGIRLRPRRPGDRFRPLGVDGTQKLQDLMINKKIPRQERASVPLLVCGDEIIWVVGYHLGAAYAIGQTTERVLVVQFRREE